MLIFCFMYFGHIRATVRALSTGFTRLIERRASRNGHRIEIDAVWISIYVSLTASRVQLRPRRDFRDYLFTAGARTRGTPHETHEGSATPPARLPTAHDRPRTRTCTIYAENSVRAAARCPTAEYPDSSRRKYEHCLATVLPVRRVSSRNAFRAIRTTSSKGKWR